MANKIIKYNLTADGTIPTYIDDGGYFPKANSNASPQDWDLIGATVDGSSETGLGELANAAAIKSYLDKKKYLDNRRIRFRWLHKLILIRQLLLMLFGQKKYNNI